MTPAPARLRAAWALASAAVIVSFSWLVTAGSWRLGRPQFWNDFYDAQARSWFEGRWDVPASVAGSEGFLVDGRTYLYFGPLPSLLRSPILLATSAFDGRLTAASMVLAMAVLAVATYRLRAAVRTLLRPDAPVDSREVAATALLAVVALVGAPWWLGSQAMVHHEAALWGVATGVLAMSELLRWSTAPSGMRLAVASAATATAASARTSIALGPLVVLAVLVAVALAGRWTRWRWAREGRAVRSPVPGLLAAVAVPILAVTLPTVARFGSLGIPAGSQLVMQFPEWREIRDANDGRLFGVEYLPTTLLAYLRPDGVDLRGDLPWIDFRTSSPVVGDVVLGPVYPTASVPSTMPALTVLAITGLAAAARRIARRQVGPAGRRLLLLQGGALVSAAGALTLGSVSHRYAADLYPAVLLPALVGFDGALGARRPARRAAALAVGAVTVLAVLATVAVNGLLALEYQRERGLVVAEAWRAAWVEQRADLGGPGPVEVRVDPDDRLPRDADDGTLAVVGDCDGLYLRVGPDWVPLERGPGVAVHDYEIDVDRLPDDGEPVELLLVGLSRLPVHGARGDDGSLSVTMRNPGDGSTVSVGVVGASSNHLRVDLDRRNESTPVPHGADPVTIRLATLRAVDPAVRHDAVHPIEPDMSLCRQLAG